MSGTRPTPNPWLTDQAIFAGYRWMAWGVTALWLLGQGRVAAYGGALAGTLLLTLLVTAFARQYIRAARQNAALLSLDILLAVAAVVATGGWDSPFVFYAYGSIVLPALLFGWGGGVMAGLTFVAANTAALTSFGSPPADRLFAGTLAGLTVGLTMVAPPTFGVIFPTFVERIRHQASHSSRGRSLRPPGDMDEPAQREPRLDPPRFTRPPREPRRGDAGMGDASIAAPLTRTRTAAPGVEELRRVIFAPFPAPEMDLGASFDVLATRFGQHTGLPTRVAMIGRTRAVRSIHRDLLIRLAQEALLNVQQHAHASAASLTIRYDVNSVALLIQDDGVGLADGTYERPGLHALRAMHYRVAEFGGRLDVFETEGGGVTVRATMPLE